MMMAQHYVIDEANLSRAWAKAMLRLLSKGVTEVSPLLVTIHLSAGDLVETKSIRDFVDDELERFEMPLCDTTASTIFPQSFWNPQAGRQALFARYEKILPCLRKYPANRYGIYFERLIKHGGTINQLNHILETWEKGNHRRSEFQATIPEPAKDQSDASMRGFPCLRQVMFIPGRDGLTVSGVYGVQYIFDRAYGNYLGLCRLGQFMAYEMGMPLIKVQCVTTIAKLGTPNKTDLEHTATALNELLLDGVAPTIEQAPRLAFDGDYSKKDGKVNIVNNLFQEVGSHAQTR